MEKESTEGRKMDNIDAPKLLNALTTIKQTCNYYTPNCNICPLRTESGTRCIFTTEQAPFEWKINTDLPEEWRAIK